MNLMFQESEKQVFRFFSVNFDFLIQVSPAQKWFYKDASFQVLAWIQFFC